MMIPTDRELDMLQQIAMLTNAVEYQSRVLAVLLKQHNRTELTPAERVMLYSLDSNSEVVDVTQRLGCADVDGFESKTGLDAGGGWYVFAVSVL